MLVRQKEYHKARRSGYGLLTVGPLPSSPFTLQHLSGDLQFPQALFADGRIFQIQRLYFRDDDVGDRDPGEPFVIGGNYIPGRPFCAGVIEYCFEGFLIVIPMGPLFRIAQRKLPVLFRSVEARQKTAALLFPRDVEKELEDRDAVADEVMLELVDLFLLPLSSTTNCSLFVFIDPDYNKLPARYRRRF